MDKTKQDYWDMGKKKNLGLDVKPEIKMKALKINE